MTDTDQTGHRHDYNVPSHAEAAHEQVEFDREIQYRQLIWMGVGLLVMALISGVVVFFLLKGFINWRDRSEGPPPVVSAPPADVPGPKLLARPDRELTNLRAAEKEQLESYGWVDQKSGVAHIPIARALELAAKKGSLPDVGSGTAPAAAAPPTPAASPAAVAPPGAAPAPAIAPPNAPAAQPAATTPGGAR